MEEIPITEYVSIIKRYKFTLILTTFFVAVLSLSIVANWSKYESISTIEIEQSDVASDYTASGGIDTGKAAEAMADQRISKIQQKVTSTASLAEVITQFNLYPEQRKTTPIATIAEYMRQKVKVTLINSTVANAGKGSSTTAIAYTISFSYDDPRLALQVANELTSRFLNEDAKQRREQAEVTTAFLDKQIKALETSMEEQEKKIAEFRQQSGDTRPEALAFNQQATAQINMSLQSIEAEIASNRGSISALRSQLMSVDPYASSIADGRALASPSMQLKALEAEYASLSAKYGSEHPDVIKTSKELAALRSQVGKKRTFDNTAVLQSKIDDLASRLETAKKTYGPDNPDVVSLSRQMESLQKQKQDAETKFKRMSYVVQDADNPTYLSLVAQLSAAEGEQEGLTARRDAMYEQLEKYRQAVLGNPEAEQQLAILARDYDNAQARYRELKAKKMSAEMTEELEKDRKGQRMTLINPPELPLSTKPSKKLLYLGALILSLAAGIASAVLRQILSTGLIGPGHLALVTGVRPLVNIPYIPTQAERYRTDRMKRYGLGLAVVAVIISVITYILKLVPFERIASPLINLLGLS